MILTLFLLTSPKRSDIVSGEGCVMILSNAAPGRLFCVIELDLPNEISRRLEALGMIKGSLVKVLRKKRHGAMMITVRGTRFAMGLSMAEHIVVKETV